MAATREFNDATVAAKQACLDMSNTVMALFDALETDHPLELLAAIKTYHHASDQLKEAIVNHAIAGLHGRRY